MGWTMAFNIKAEWAFDFQFWPVTVAVRLDLFQIIGFFFVIFDVAIFGPYTAYLKFLCDSEKKKKAAGKVGKFAKGGAYHITVEFSEDWEFKFQRAVRTLKRDPRIPDGLNIMCQKRNGSIVGVKVDPPGLYNADGP